MTPTTYLVAGLEALGIKQQPDAADRAAKGDGIEFQTTITVTPEGCGNNCRRGPIKKGGPFSDRPHPFRRLIDGETND